MLLSNKKTVVRLEERFPPPPLLFAKTNTKNGGEAFETSGRKPFSWITEQEKCTQSTDTWIFFTNVQRNPFTVGVSVRSACFRIPLEHLSVLFKLNIYSD